MLDSAVNFFCSECPGNEFSYFGAIGTVETTLEEDVLEIEVVKSLPRKVQKGEMIVRPTNHKVGEAIRGQKMLERLCALRPCSRVTDRRRQLARFTAISTAGPGFLSTSPCRNREAAQGMRNR